MSKTQSHHIAVIPGDGTGPEVMREGLKVLRAAAEQHDLSLELQEFDLGGERYLRTRETLPDSVLEELKSFDAIYLSAIGHPDVKPGILEREILLRLRFDLDLYINLRPVKLVPGVKTPLADVSKGIDLVVVRENTEGLYAGAGGYLKRGTADEVATQESINTRKGVERCLRYAFELARSRPRKQLHLVGKTNVLIFASELWARAFEEIGEEYPDVRRAYHHVDACCMYLVQSPHIYDVIVTDNMFGDIITDIGGIIQGGLGIACSGNLRPERDVPSLFEPVGGSAPQFTGQNVINPLACIGAGALLLHHLGEHAAANAIEAAVAKIAGELPGLNVGEMGCGTDEVGDRVQSQLGSLTPS